MKSKGVAKLLDLGETAAKAFGTDRFEWQTMKMFLILCAHGGEMPQQEIEKVSGWSQASVSRNVAKLGSGIGMDDPGARLLETYEDPAWRRRKIVRLTARGRDLCEKLTAFMA